MECFLPYPLHCTCCEQSNFDPRGSSECVSLCPEDDARDDKDNESLVLCVDIPANCAPDAAAWWDWKVLLQVLKPFKEVTTLAEKGRSISI